MQYKRKEKNIFVWRTRGRRMVEKCVVGLVVSVKVL